jgi:hypothetical protein
MGKKRQHQNQDLNMPGEEEFIGENAYMVRMLTMRDWLELKTLLLRLIGPAIAEFFAGYTSGSIKKSDFLDSTNTKMIGSAIYAFTERANTEEYARFLEILGGCTWVNGKVLGKVGHAEWWPRHMSELGGYLKHALMVQFRDFISGLRREILPEELGQ